jgi:hypothetical protein
VSSATHIGVRNSETLRLDVETFISNIRAGSSEDQIPLLVQVMERFLDEAIDALILGASRAMKLEGLARKVVDVTVSTTKATCHLLSGRVLRKMKNGDVRELAEYMDVLRMKRVDVNGKPATFTAFPIDAELMADIDALAALIQSESPQQHVEKLVSVIRRLMDAVVEHLYVNTLHTLSFGPFASKMVDMAYHTVHKAAHALVNRVIPGLSDTQIRDAVAFCYSLVIPPESDPVPAAN